MHFYMSDDIFLVYQSIISWLYVNKAICSERHNGRLAEEAGGVGEESEGAGEEGEGARLPEPERWNLWVHEDKDETGAGNKYTYNLYL